MFRVAKVTDTKVRGSYPFTRLDTVVSINVYTGIWIFSAVIGATAATLNARIVNIASLYAQYWNQILAKVSDITTTTLSTVVIESEGQGVVADCPGWSAAW